VGTWILRVKQPNLPRSFTVKALPLVATLAVVSCLWLMLNLTAGTWVRFIVWMVVGVVIYFAYSRRSSVLGKRERGEESSVTSPAQT
ncbi:MAG: basic amino acid/polyamine antiporter, family, partial [Actinomycetota bacterium]|nr:basic amino acid/polyamine antiporter, family [Actinomycetota bacterium]